MSVVAVATTTTTSCERDRSTHQYTRNPYLLGSWKVKRPPSSRVLLSLKVATAPYTQTGTHTHTHFYMNTLYITLHKSPLSICRLLVELTSATFSRYWYVLWVAQSLPLSRSTYSISLCWQAISIFRSVGSLRLIDAPAPSSLSLHPSLCAVRHPFLVPPLYHTLK